MSWQEPVEKRVSAFFDCQNLFHSAKNLWNYSYPNFAPISLARLLTLQHQHDGWLLTEIRLYTGIHNRTINPEWHDFWVRKLEACKSSDPRVSVFTTPLRYTDNNTRCAEKGVDIRIALDIVSMARRNKFDVALLFSQDNDFREVAIEVRALVKETQRWIKIVSALPDDASRKSRGVDKTDWLPISKAEYDSCIDPTDYRP